MRKTLACLLIPTFITFYNTNKANALSTEVENKVINNINNDTNEDDFSLMTRYLNYELEYQRDTFQAKVHRDIKSRELIKQKVNERIDRIEERHRQEEEKKRKEKEERNSYNIDFVLTYYSRHPSENGGHNCTCIGTPLREGIVANNYYPIGTKLELEDGRIYVVEDRGGTKHFNNYNRLDVFIDTYDVNYVNSLGVTKIKGRIIY